MGVFSKIFNSNNKTSEKSTSWIPANGFILRGSDGFRFERLQDDDKLINEGYTSNTDVYAIIKKLCEVSSTVPFVVKSYDKASDEWVEDADSSLNSFLKQPNELTNGKDFRFNTMLYLLNTGDYFWRPVIGGFGLVTELELLPSNLVEIQLDGNNKPSYYEYHRLDGMTERIPLEDLYHGMYFNPSLCGLKSYRGLSPLQAAYNSLTASNDRQLAQASLYKNRGATNIISSGSDIALSPDERDKLQKASDKILGGAQNFNKSIVTNKNVNVQQLGMSATDLRLIEAKDLDLRDICNAFAVPSTLFNDQAASTLDNLKIGRKLMYEDAIIPNNEKLLALLNEVVTPAYSAYEGKELMICQDTSSIEALQEDQETKVNKQATEVSTILSIADNESLTPQQKEVLYNQLGYEL